MTDQPDDPIPVIDLRRFGYDTDTREAVLVFVRKDGPDLAISFPPAASGRIAAGAGEGARLARLEEADRGRPTGIGHMGTAPMPARQAEVIGRHPLTGAVHLRLTLPGGQEFLFGLTPGTAVALGTSLLVRSDRTPRPI